MTIGIIGATGRLGGHAVDALLDGLASPSEIVALGRNPERLETPGRRGVRSGFLDLEDSSATATRLEGVDVLVLVSVGGMSGGVKPRTRAVEAAKAAGVGRIVYTSVLEAPTTRLVIAADHLATERVIEASGIPATILRNGWYTENQRPDFDAARERGVIANSIGTGRIASATRREYGEAIAVVATAAGHEGSAYELSGDTAWSFSDFAEACALVLSRPVRYEVLTPKAERERLAASGLDRPTADLFSRAYADMSGGALSATTGDLARLVGHPTEPLLATLQSWV